ncbi:MAG: SurA N-terminal domain-containing protein [Candidatus Omnitrophota bacterium]
MLKKLRNKKTAKKIWIILIILIVPAFVFWGFGSYVRSKQETSYTGIISGRRITFLEYKGALDAVRNQAIIQFGDNLSEIEKNLNLQSQAWERLILLAEAKRRRINASDIEVIQTIQSYPFFQKKNAEFDNQAYSQMLQYVFYAQPRVFEEQTRQNLIISKLYKVVTDNLRVSEEIVKEEYKKINEQVDLSYIASNPSDFAKDIVASEEKIKDYFAKNPLQFKQPLSFNIEYISLALDDKDKQALEEKIKKLFSRLNKRDGFANVSKEFNLQVKESGFFGLTDPIPGIGWSPQILSLISKLKIGEFSLPIRMDKSYYILRLKERKEPYIPDFQSIKNKVKESFIKDSSREIAQKKIEDCLKELRELYRNNPKSVNFDHAVKAYGLKSDSTNFFKYGGYLAGIGVSDNFFTLAQKLKEDEPSEIINMPSGFYIVKLKGRILIDENKFKEEKDEFAKKMLLQKKLEYFAKFMDELKKRVQVF